MGGLGRIQGFVRVPADSSASQVAAKLRSRSFIQEAENSTRSLLVGDKYISDAETISIEAIRVEPVAFSTTTSTRTTVTTTVNMMATSTSNVGSAETSLTTFLSSSTAP